jgi:RNA polymerase sigma factor (sigma-70 family)
MVNEYTRNAKRRVSSEIPVAELAELVEQPAGGSFENQVVDRDRLWSLLAVLSPSERAAVVLRYYEDMSYSQAAEVLGCRASTVRANASKALARLRRSLEVSEEVSS